ncbi:PREDICTED: uncharacterized protein LOC107082086 [Cyprinodon variegatus]|uniref:uncharacterized protein LOC107082086 n=1 Tax=Cyprinodon variegatus TaxID=28743 RepID=UPI00074256AE|nr:PREDICTED: uncharacterized protein LOC107082086 [Cyprinodon variegatus]
MDVGRNSPRDHRTRSEECVVPVAHYWYVSQIYKDEIRRIEKETKVSIMPTVTVAFNTEHEGGNPSEALYRFADLVQKCLSDSTSSVIPLKFVDPNRWGDALKVINNNDSKLLVTMSSEGMTVCGPQDCQNVLSSTLNATQKFDSPEEPARSARSQNFNEDKNVLSSTLSATQNSKWALEDSERPASSKDISVDLCPNSSMMMKSLGDAGPSMEENQWRKKNVRTSLRGKDEKRHKEDMVLPVKQKNPLIKAGGAAQESCLLPVDPFWYMSHIYKEEMKCIERNNKSKITAQVHVTFEAGRPNEALCEFIELYQSCLAESGSVMIPLKFVDPDQWSDALKVIKKNKDKLLLSMSSDEVIVCGPKKGQDEFSAVLNAMQKINHPIDHLKPVSVGTSPRMSNVALNASIGQILGERKEGDGKDDQCYIPVCMSGFTNKEQLKCKHAFCKGCLQRAVQHSGSICPICKDVFGVVKGNQPDGTMSWKKHNYTSLPGFPGCGFIEISYYIPAGLQTVKYQLILPILRT